MSSAETMELGTKADEVAELLSSMAHPQRLRILCQMADRECSVLSFADSTGLTQPAISHHLKKLREAGVVKTRRDAQTIYYSIASDEVRKLMDLLYNMYCRVG